MLLHLDWRTIFASAVVGALIGYPITKGLDAVVSSSQLQTGWYDIGSTYDSTYTPSYDSTYSPGRRN